MSNCPPYQFTAQSEYMKMTHLLSRMHCTKSLWSFLWIKNIRVKWLSNTFQVINWKEVKIVSFCWRWSGGIRPTRMGHREGYWLHVTTVSSKPTLLCPTLWHWTGPYRPFSFGTQAFSTEGTAVTLQNDCVRKAPSSLPGSSLHCDHFTWGPSSRCEV